jgi:hypothetical protein
MSRGPSLPVLSVDTAAPSVHVPGPVETALATLWRERAPRLFQPRAMIKQLRLRRRFDLEPVRLEKLRIAIPTGQVPDCDNCVDLCCTGDHALVSLRLRDIAVLMDIGRTELITHERPPPPKMTTWARREAEGSIFHAAFPVLARDETKTCRALTDDRLCGLWPSWPLSCARYPYALDRRHGVIFYAAGCTSTRLAPVSEAPVAIRALVRAVVDAYNERLRDVLLLAFARDELRDLGLLRWIKEDRLEGL